MEKRNNRLASKPCKEISAIGDDFEIGYSYFLNNDTSRNNNQESTTSRNCVENKKKMHKQLLEIKSAASEIQGKNLSWGSEYSALKHMLIIHTYCRSFTAYTDILMEI